MPAITDLKDGECRYPTTDASPHDFCGVPVARGSYCAAHAAICFDGPGKPWQSLAGMIDAVEETVTKSTPREDVQPEIDDVFSDSFIDRPGGLMRRL